MAKSKNLDKELEKSAGYETIDPSTLPDYPIVYDPPEGWPPLLACDGDSWFERAEVYERMTGRKVLPNEYVYDENGNIMRREDNPNCDTIEEINEANAHIYNKGVENGD